MDKNQSDVSSISDQESISINDTLNEASLFLKDANVIKDELCRLPLNPKEKEYFDNNILPLLSLLNHLTSFSVNLSGSVKVLTDSPIVFRKKSKIKSTIDLIYDINDKCEDIYKILEKRIDILLTSYK